MPKRGSTPNTRSGGQPAEAHFRQIVADPNGNREQRRAAQRLTGGQPQTDALVVAQPTEEDQNR